MKIKEGNYIKSPRMGVEGVVTAVTQLHKLDNTPLDVYRVNLFCILDKTYPPNSGKNIRIRIDAQFWEVVSEV